jgi:hypothetical protein
MYIGVGSKETIQFLIESYNMPKVNLLQNGLPVLPANYVLRESGDKKVSNYFNKIFYLYLVQNKN